MGKLQRCLKRVPAIVVLLLIPALLWSGTTGKITGRVQLAGSREPLPSASVVIEGTAFGAVSNIEGEFIILNIPPGTYSLRASMIGHTAAIVREVVVRVDLTTRIDFELTESTVEMDAVVVRADQKMINKDETSRTSIVSSQTFSDLPVVSSQEVVALQAGFVTGSDGALHARGGRSGEVTYLIDGVPMRDPLSNSFAGQVDKYAIEELQVLTGGFNAEYGQALSGVVNIVTKEGGNNYTGRIEYTSAQLNESPYHTADALALDEWGINDAGNLVPRVDAKGDALVANVPSAYKKQTLADTPGLWPDINMLGQLSVVLGGPMPLLPDLKFYITGRYSNALDQLPWGYSKEREINAKLTYTLGAAKINLSSRRNYRVYKPYAHAWKYMPEGYETRTDNSWADNVKLNYLLSPTTLFEGSASYNRRVFNRFTPGKSAEFSETGALLSSNYRIKNNNTPPFWTNTDNGVYSRNTVGTVLIKGDLASQIESHNYLKAGAEIRFHRIERFAFQEPYPSGFHAFENYLHRPLEYSLYLQDKLEFSIFVLNAGVRYDYVDVDDSQWESTRSPAGYVNALKEWTPVGEIPSPPKHQFSPRIGIAFPVTDETVIYGSYGHFFQIPDYIDMYTSRDPTMDAGIVGNPGILPQKTVAYEFGVKQQIGVDYAVNVSVYFKDITNLVGSTYLAVFPYEYSVFDNSNYGGIQGFEVTLNKRLADYWFANLNYTYSVAKGNESDPREGYNDFRRASAILRPKRVFPLDFDRQHVLYGTLGIEFPEAFGPEIAGFHLLEKTSMNFIVRASSGLPYTPIAPEESNTLLVEKNSGRMPSVNRVDFRIARSLAASGLKFTLFGIVNNVLDAVNATNVWAYTGLPLDAGPSYNRTKDRMRNPEYVDARRSIQVGIRLDF